MLTKQTKSIYITLANIASVIWHPLFMPVYGMAIIFSTQTLYGYLPFNVKKLLFLILIINNVLLPFALLPYFRYRNIISSLVVNDRRERYTPLLITTLLYATTSYIIFKFPIPFFLKSLMFATFFLSLTLTVINFWWKISFHSAAAGSLMALIIVLSIKMNVTLSWYLISSIVVSGILLSSRLKLNSHTPAQVWTGFLTGLFGYGTYLWFF